MTARRHGTIPVVEEVLGAHRAALGTDFDGYRHHVYRVVHFCLALAPDTARRLDTIATAAAFHDLGIWTARTFDYLEPSIRLARAHLDACGAAGAAPEIARIIAEHHKVTPWRGADAALVEPFRRADWIDVTGGLLRFGLPRSFIAEVMAQWPAAGFHARLLRLALDRVRHHPRSPLPMLHL